MSFGLSLFTEFGLIFLSLNTFLILNIVIWNQGRSYSDFCVRRMRAALAENINTGRLEKTLERTWSWRRNKGPSKPVLREICWQGKQPGVLPPVSTACHADQNGARGPGPCGAAPGVSQPWAASALLWNRTMWDCQQIEQGGMLAISHQLGIYC